jgi:hypothetical protein
MERYVHGLFSSRLRNSWKPGRPVGEARELVPGDPTRPALAVFSALLGLVSLSTDGKFKDESLDYLGSEFIERMIPGFRPRT